MDALRQHLDSVRKPGASPGGALGSMPSAERVPASPSSTFRDPEEPATSAPLSITGGVAQLTADDFINDSPSFWEFLDGETNKLEEIAETLSNTSEELRDLFPCGDEGLENRRPFDNLNKLLCGFQFEALASLQTLTYAAQTLRDFRSMLDRELEGTFINPLKDVFHDDLAYLKDKRQHYNDLLVEYLERLKGHIGNAKASGGDPREVARRLKSDRLVAELHRFDIVSQVEQLRRAKHSNVLKAFKGFMKTQKFWAQKILDLVDKCDADVGSLDDLIRSSDEDLLKFKMDRQAERRIIEKKIAEIMSLPVDSDTSSGSSGIRDVDFKPSATAPLQKSGYLFLPFKLRSIKETAGKKPKPARSRVWCTVSQGKLRLHTKSGSKALDLLTCTVKEAPEHKMRFCFQVISPTDSLILQSESFEDMQDWMATIGNAISAQLNKSMSDAPSGGGPSELNLKGASGRASIHRIRTNTEMYTKLTDIAGNEICAECKAENPDWCSVNLGIVICVECSGIHRGLGVHISQVRSLTLDKLDKYTVSYMSALGNIKSNKVWLKGLKEEDMLVGPDSSREDKKAFIFKKYNKEDFRKRNKLNLEDVAGSLLDACMDQDGEPIMTWIAAEADVNIQLEDESKNTALHLLIKAGNIGLAEMLIKNGAIVSSVDSELRTPLHLAASLDDVASVKYLLARGADKNALDASGATPLDLALQNGAERAMAELSARTSRLLVDAVKVPRAAGKSLMVPSPKKLPPAKDLSATMDSRVPPKAASTGALSSLAPGVDGDSSDEDMIPTAWGGGVSGDFKHEDKRKKSKVTRIGGFLGRFKDRKE